MERASGNNDFSEWSYENLSYWNSEIHGKCLSYRHFQFKLYPRGLSGDGEHLVVRVYDPNFSSRVELSYIGSDGTLFYKQEIQDPKWDTSGYLELPPGPRFEDVVRTAKNENLMHHKDILTLRLYRSDHTGIKFHGHTTIEMADTCLRMPAVMFKDVELEKYAWISGISLGDCHQRYDLNLNARLVGPTLEDAEIVFVFIPSFEKNLLIHIRVSLVDSNDVVVKSGENTHIFRDRKSLEIQGILHGKEIMKKGFHLNLCIKYISGDIRNVDHLASVEYKESSPITVPPENLTEDLTAAPSNNPVTVLSRELMCLYQDQDFSDLQLECGKVTFPVHKNILSARSPVFKTMLFTDMKEAASSAVDIEDLDPSTLGLFLTYLYTGTVEDLQCDGALKLYYAADKYQVPTLKGECGDFLCDNVSVSNVCDVLSLADKHRDDKLVAVSQDFILENYNEVLKSEEWKSFMLKEPLLGVKTLTQYVERNKMGVIRG